MHDGPGVLGSPPPRRTQERRVSGGATLTARGRAAHGAAQAIRGRVRQEGPRRRSGRCRHGGRRQCGGSRRGGGGARRRSSGCGHGEAARPVARARELLVGLEVGFCLSGGCRVGPRRRLSTPRLGVEARGSLHSDPICMRPSTGCFATCAQLSRANPKCAERRHTFRSCEIGAAHCWSGELSVPPAASMYRMVERQRTRFRACARIYLCSALFARAIALAQGIARVRAISVGGSCFSMKGISL